MPFQILSKLDAINRMLLAARERPVNDLINDGSNDTDIAEQILNDVNLLVQMEGGHYNELDIEATPNSSGRFILPNETIFVTGREEHYCRDFTWRHSTSGVTLWDKETNEAGEDPTVFEDEELKLTIITGVLWEELPYYVRNYIADEAARRYQMVRQGSVSMDNMLEAVTMHSRAVNRARDIEATKTSIVNSPNNAMRAVANRHDIGLPYRYGRF